MTAPNIIAPKDGRSPDGSGKRRHGKSGLGSPEARRRASTAYYARNRDVIRAKRNEQERLNPRVKDRTTPKERARQKVRHAVWAGKLVKPKACQDCGSEKPVQGHHEDYDRALDVRWLCAPCHAAAHAQERRKA